MDQSGQANNDQNKSHDKTPSRFRVQWWWILAGTIVLLAGLFIVSHTFNDTLIRINFLTVNTLSILVLAAIAVQAFIYHRQREVMEKQWEIMERSLVVQSRAYIGILDIQAEWSKRLILVTIQNTGIVPAEDIHIIGDAIVLVGPNKEPQSLHHKIDHVFGHTKLFTSGLKIRFSIHLDKVDDRYIPLFSQEGALAVLIRGHIHYRDGFGVDEQATEFAHSFWSGTDNEWHSFPIWTPEEWLGLA